MKSRAVVSGRLHTAVVAFSLGIPFLLLDIDQRTRGFVRTYLLEDWTIAPAMSGMLDCLEEKTKTLFSEDRLPLWQSRVEKRNEMYKLAMALLTNALKSIR